MKEKEVEADEQKETSEDLKKKLSEQNKELDKLKEKIAETAKEEERINLTDHKHCNKCNKPMKNDPQYALCVDCRPSPQPRRI